MADTVNLAALGVAPLFCPADRTDRFEKALAAADSVILDLEDAVAPERKEFAREQVYKALQYLPVDRTIVRINPPVSNEGQRDLAMLRDTQLRFVLVPKTSSPEDMVAARPFASIGLCETALGIQNANEIAQAPDCAGLMWGGEDLTADIGGWRSRDRNGAYLPHVHYARARILIAASAAKKWSWDGVYLDIPDLPGLERECDDAVSMGFSAKVAIHPSQIASIRNAYQPGEEQVRWAKRLLAAIHAGGSGVIAFEGRMIDGPLIKMAKAMVATATPSHESGEM